jgi:hypothetical protein
VAIPGRRSIQAVTDIGVPLGDSPRQRDLMIEFLHRIQDRYNTFRRRTF